MKKKNSAVSVGFMGLLYFRSPTTLHTKIDLAILKVNV